MISNKGAEAVNRSLARHHMTAVIDRVFAEQPGRPAKPDPALFAADVRPHFPAIGKERILMIGDSEVDIAFAKRAGIASCWAAYGFGDSERCLALAPDYCIERIEALPAVFAGEAPLSSTAISRSQPAHRCFDLADKGRALLCGRDIEMIKRVIIGARAPASEPAQIASDGLSRRIAHP